ncbi:MAG TPA: WD40 repeat domain-containing protein [Tepidisphaeraceae bacterium]|nr:WD40 repeat domain-containing protein [Tepidisphaeraceae bacterium]
MPTVEDQANAEKLVKEVLAAEYAQKTPAARIALARKLMELSADTSGEPAGRYVLFREARDAFHQGGDYAGMVGAIDGMSTLFSIDVRAEKLAGLSKAATGPGLTADAAKSVVEALLSLTAEAQAAEDHDGAVKAATQAEAIARRGGDAGLRVRATERLADAKRGAADHAAYQAAVERLRAEPGNAAARLAAGKYLCFSRQDWARGLPMLAEGSDGRLKSLAATELDPAATVDGRLETANGWASVAEQQSGAAKLAVQRHAIELYARLVPELVGLRKSLAQQRLAALTAAVTGAGKTAPAGGGPAAVVRGAPVDPKALRLVGTTAPQKGGIVAIALSADGSTLLVGDEKQIRTYNARTGAPKATIDAHGGKVVSLAISRDGKRLASGGADKVVKIWNLDSGREHKVMPGHPGSPNALAFSADGQTLATAGDTVRLIDPAGGTERFAFTLPTAGGGTFVRAVDVSADGKLVAMAVRAPQGGTTVNLYDAGQNEPRVKWPGHDIVRFSPSGKHVAAGPAKNNGAVGVYDLATKGLVFETPAHGAKVRCAAFSPDGGVLVTGGEDKTVKLLEGATGKLVATQSVPATVVAVTFSQDGSALAVALDDKTVQVYAKK